jgi:hypothetical protein
MIEANTTLGVAILPDGNGGFTLCPELLTDDEAIRYLRLDTLGLKSPKKTLERYIQLGYLQPTQISGKNFFRRQDLDEFLLKMCDKSLERRKRCGSKSRKTTVTSRVPG